MAIRLYHKVLMILGIQKFSHAIWFESFYAATFLAVLIREHLLTVL